jgi:hypothetical protein
MITESLRRLRFLVASKPMPRRMRQTWLMLKSFGQKTAVGEELGIILSNS